MKSWGGLTASRVVAASLLLAACNTLVGVSDDYHRAPGSGGSDGGSALSGGSSSGGKNLGGARSSGGTSGEAATGDTGGSTGGTISAAGGAPSSVDGAGEGNLGDAPDIEGGAGGLAGANGSGGAKTNGGAGGSSGSASTSGGSAGHTGAGGANGGSIGATGGTSASGGMNAGGANGGRGANGGTGGVNAGGASGGVAGALGSGGAPPVPVCGNGVLESGEVCDDYNTTVGDGCNASCKVETGWTCTTASPSACLAKCGDGVVLGNETCDDGGTTSGDGCSATCKLEAGWTCAPGAPTKCTRPSCAGMTGTECRDGGDCCASPLVSGGTFTQGNGTSTSFSSTVASFRLDKYEVTVGRFRNFVSAYNAWIQSGNPASGAGSNPNIMDSGWVGAWTASLPSSSSLVTSNLNCTNYATWPNSGGKDQLPINCVSWLTAFAFCIWDGGRLPTESEWEYAATGGTHYYTYPWGNTPVPTNAQDTTATLYANYYCLGDGSAGLACAFSDILDVGARPMGKGFYGQDDLGGSMWEWVLDWSGAYPTSASANYANVASGTNRVIRGGGFGSDGAFMAATMRNNLATGTHDAVGFRCARSP